MLGQAADTVTVREVVLGNGQRATIIMEAGRIKRIVAANGQVAELRWQTHEPSPLSNEGRLPLTVSLLSGSSHQCAPAPAHAVPGWHGSSAHRLVLQVSPWLLPAGLLRQSWCGVFQLHAAHAAPRKRTRRSLCATTAPAFPGCWLSTRPTGLVAGIAGRGA